jgi:hypothetical protein
MYALPAVSFEGAYFCSRVTILLCNLINKIVYRGANSSASFDTKGNKAKFFSWAFFSICAYVRQAEFTRSWGSSRLLGGGGGGGGACGCGGGKGFDGGGCIVGGGSISSGKSALLVDVVGWGWGGRGGGVVASFGRSVSLRREGVNGCGGLFVPFPFPGLGSWLRRWPSALVFLFSSSFAISSICAYVRQAEVSPRLGTWCPLLCRKWFVGSVLLGV